MEKTIDIYDVEALLGKGGMGEVYRAYDRALQRPVALKIVSRSHLTDADFVARFEREARAASSLSHPNVAHIYAIGRFEGRPYYVMELVEGKTLSQLLSEQGRLTAGRAVELLRQAAEGLRAAHQKGVVHRDIKPDNLMLDAEGRLKVVDFGLARKLESGHTITRLDRVMGTPRYMSPEQAREGRGDHRSDMYSLGATFYHLLAGVPPFDADTSVSIMLKHVNDPPPPLAGHARDIPPALAAFIHRLLAKQPENRFADYDALLRALDGVAGASPVHQGAATRPIAGPDHDATVLTPRTAGAAPQAAPAVAVAGQPAPAVPTRAWLVPALAGGGLTLVAIVVSGFLGQDAAHDSPEAQARPAQTEPAPSPVPTEAAAAPAAAPVRESFAPPTRPPAQPDRIALREAGDAPPLEVAEPSREPAPRPGRGGPRGFLPVRPQLLERGATRAELERLKLVLEDHVKAHGAPPAALSEAGVSRAVDGWGEELRYQRVDGGYRVTSAGMDRRFDSDDDFVLENGRLSLPRP